MAKAEKQEPKARDRKPPKQTPVVSSHVIQSAELGIDKLVPYAQNARLHSPAQVEKIADSIARFGFTNPVLVWGKGNEIVAGHGRVLAAQKLLDSKRPEFQYLKKIPVRRVDHLTDLERRALVLADNKLALDAAWDDAMLARELKALSDAEFDIAVTGFDASDIKIDEDGITINGAGGTGTGAHALAERFLIPPFSVLNAREGWWQDRKRAWLSLGIRSEIGRGENASPGGAPRPAMDYSNKERGDGAGKPLKGKLDDLGKAAGAKRKFGQAFNTQDMLNDAKFKGKKAIPGGGTGKNSAFMFKQEDGSYAAGDEAQQSGTGTSIFDPVLCEIAYRWFSKEGAQILDPFSGGSVRGIVAGRLGRKYFGVDLRPEQIAANREQVKDICKDTVKPQYATGDSVNIGALAKGIKADLLFSCPPYADLEVYSEMPGDISNMEYPEFRSAYFKIIDESCKLLKDDRFAVWVIGEARDKKGNYYNLVGDTISAFKAAGLEYYNEAILVTAVGSLPLRVNGQFCASRKLGKTHQNVLVFVKGDAKKATKAAGDIVIEKDLFPADSETEE